MAQLLVRDLSPDIVAGLKRRAVENGRSAEAEHRAILEEVLKPAAFDFWAEAERLRAEFKGRPFTPSEELIREIRDEQ